MTERKPTVDPTWRSVAASGVTSEVAATMSQANASIDTSQTGVPKAAKSNAPETSVPTQFGRYKIERELGKGAMGVVYLAEDTTIGRKVALKIPRKSILEEPEALERFYREAKTTGQIRHPNICPVFDVGAIDGTHYLTMAYIPGKPINSFLGKGKLPAAKQVALLIRKIALALDEAHRLGVVHRDLKPANVMLDDRGEPIVMDFGLACNTNTAEQARLTQSGAILGTPAYMAPEQVHSETNEIGPQSDVYALGVMMYQFLTGELPFSGPVMTVFAQILRDQPKRPSELRPDVDPALEAICLKMMAKELSQRYTSMKEVAAALKEFLKTGAVTGPDIKKIDPPLSTNGAAEPSTDKRAVFSDRVTEEEVQLAQTKAKSRQEWGKLPPLWLLVMTGVPGGLLAAVLYAVLFLQWGSATLKIEIDDPSLKVSFGKQELTIENDGAPITLRPGKQSLKVLRDGLEVDVKEFVLKRSETKQLAVTLVDDKVTWLEGNVLPKNSAAEAPAAESPVGLSYAVDENNSTQWKYAKSSGWNKEERRSGVWKAGGAELDPDTPEQFRYGPSGNVLVCETITDDIYTEQNYGDVRVELEFMIPKGSNSGIFLMGNYQIILNDTDQSGQISGGPKPMVVARKPAGEWQSLEITFQAPRFDAAGHKTQSARFANVLYNGQLIYENVTLNESTTDPSMLAEKELAAGPLLLQGSRGPVAYRNIRITPQEASTLESALTGKLPVPTANRIAQLQRSAREAMKSELGSGKPEDLSHAAQLFLTRTSSLEGAEEKYALLDLARDLLAQAGDIPNSLKVCEQLDHSYLVNGAEIKVRTFRRLAQGAKTSNAVEKLLEVVLTTGFESLAAENFKACEDAAQLAAELAQSPLLVNPGWLPEGKEYEYQARFLSEELAKAKTAYALLPEQAKLATEATSDLKCNALRGQYACLIKNDWIGGGEFLKAAGEPWQSLMKREGPPPTNAADRITLGDLWWDAADGLQEPFAMGARRRARQWYLAALAEMKPEETTLAAARLQPRIDQVPRTPMTLRIRMQQLNGYQDLQIDKDGVRTSGRGGRKITGDIQVNHLHWTDHVEGHRNFGATRLLPDGIDFSTARIAIQGHSRWGAAMLVKTPEYIKVYFWHHPTNERSNFDVTLEIESAGFNLPARFTQQWDVAYYDWPKGEPYSHEALLQKKPVDVVKQVHVNFFSEVSPLNDWRPGAPPTTKVGQDYFAMTATSSWELPAGRYKPVVYVDDGVRVFIDDELVLDRFPFRKDAETLPEGRELALSAGTHKIYLEYYQDNGSAYLQFDLKRLGD